MAMSLSPKWLWLSTKPSSFCPSTFSCQKDGAWNQQSQALLLKQNLSENDQISYAGYFSAVSSLPNINPSVTGLFPLFEEKAATMPMMTHGLAMICKAIEKLNEGQIPVVTCDQPLFALMKNIQWQFPEYSEDKVVVMLGGLHIEMCVWTLLGKLLQNSGWEEAMVEGGVTTVGRAQAILHASHLKRTRYVHEVSVVVFSRLKRQAFVESDTELTFDAWCSEQLKSSPTFFFWDLILRFQTLSFMLVRSFRQRNFDLYIACLERIVPFCFALDAVNYSRWLSVHIRDMKSLPSQTLGEFKQGNFTVTKSNHKFSSIAIDHAHEITNKVIKGNGGAIGMFQNRDMLTRWLVVTPELSRVIEEFNHFQTSRSDYIDEQDDDLQIQHHEHSVTFQKKFHLNAKNLYNSIINFGNPFAIEDPRLLSLTTQDAFDASVIEAMRSLESTGQTQYQKFNHDVLETGTKSINDTI